MMLGSGALGEAKTTKYRYRYRIGSPLHTRLDEASEMTSAGVVPAGPFLYLYLYLYTVRRFGR